MRLFVTGGCGFIGANFVYHVLRERPDASILNYDALTYAGNRANLLPLEEEATAAAQAGREPRYRFLRGDIADPRPCTRPWPRSSPTPS
jgi:dTDP-glucose 4,6-dehydratase